MKNILIAIALLGAATFGIYGGTLAYPFVFDDTHVILTNYKIKDPAHIPKFFYERAMIPEEEDTPNATYRPFLFATYALNYMASGLDPGSYRLVNILIHLLCAFFVYLIAGSLLEKAPPEGAGTARAANSGWYYALVAALVFAVHPVQTETVVYVSARSASLMALGCLASLWFFIRYAESRRPAWLGGALVAYAAALMSKENAVPFLLAFPLVARALERKGGKGWRTPVLAYAPLAAAALALTVRRFTLIRAFGEAGQLERGLVEQWMSALAALTKYAQLTVFPFGLSVDHDFRSVASAADIHFITGAAAAAAALLAFVYFYKREPALSALVAWPFLAMSPEMLLPVKDIVVEYRLYLPLAGLSILAAYTVRRFAVSPEGKRALASAVSSVLIIAAFSTVSYGRVRVWRDPAVLWADAVLLYPDNVRARNNLGKALGMAGDYAGAIEQLRMAVRLDPKQFDSLVNLGNAYAEAGKLQKSIDVYKSALAIDPADYSANYNLALSYMDIGDFEAAYEVYAGLVKAFPDRKELPYTFAEVFASRGRGDLSARFITRYSRPAAR